MVLEVSLVQKVKKLNLNAILFNARYHFIIIILEIYLSDGRYLFENLLINILCICLLMLNLLPTLCFHFPGTKMEQRESGQELVKCVSSFS